MASYLRPTSLEDALKALGDGPRVIVAGGTDYYPARVGKPLDDDVLDVTAIDGLRAIEETADSFRIGALTTWTDVIRADLPPWFDGMKLAAKEVGGVQVQNAGTVVGNICNASPAADGVPNLFAMDCGVIVASAGGERTVPIGDFILGNRKTALDQGEMVVGLTLPKPAHSARSTFLKLGARKYLVISIVMVAAILEEADDGSVAAARVAVGSCSEVARRLPELEAALVGQPLDASLVDHVAASHLAPLSPIDDVRATSDYRNDAALTLVGRALSELGSAQ